MTSFHRNVLQSNFLKVNDVWLKLSKPRKLFSWIFWVFVLILVLLSKTRAGVLGEDGAGGRLELPHLAAQ